MTLTLFLMGHSSPARSTTFVDGRIIFLPHALRHASAGMGRAISLTPGSGPPKHASSSNTFGSPEAVFRASLTELESTGIQPVSAQSLATGKSAVLVREEIASATAADSMMISMDGSSYPPRLKEIHDPPLIVADAQQSGSADQSRHCHAEHAATPRPTVRGMAERLACDLAA
jgi:DNA processing protein